MQILPVGKFRIDLFGGGGSVMSEVDSGEDADLDVAGISPCEGIVGFRSLTSFVERKQAARVSCSRKPANQSL